VEISDEWQWAFAIAPACDEMAREDDGRWGKERRFAEANVVQPFCRQTLEKVSLFMAGKPRVTA
jgi:hypothetical protein